MAKLNQIIAVSNGLKTKAQKAITDVHRKSEKSELYGGINRVYQPLNDDGERLPSESNRVRLTAKDVFSGVQDALSELMDVTATQDYANCEAKADVVVDDNVILEQVPVTHLLFLEKQLIDIHTVVNKMPTLDIAHDWKYDDNNELYVTPTAQTNRTKKVHKHKVMVEPTEHHPAQVSEYTEDELVGTWNTTYLCGALPASEKKQVLQKVESLQKAVKFAREEANSSEVNQVKNADKVFNFIFGE